MEVVASSSGLHRVTGSSASAAQAIPTVYESGQVMEIAILSIHVVDSSLLSGILPKHSNLELSMVLQGFLAHEGGDFFLRPLLFNLFQSCLCKVCAGQ